MNIDALNKKRKRISKETVFYCKFRNRTGQRYDGADQSSTGQRTTGNGNF